MVVQTSPEDKNNNSGAGREGHVSFQVDEKPKKEEETDAMLNTKMMEGESGDMQSFLSQPEPFEPDLRPTSEPEPESPATTTRSTRAVSRLSKFPAEDVRESKRVERLKKKEMVEKDVSLMISESALKIEISMEATRAGNRILTKTR